MNAKRIEQQSLNRGVIINILMGSAGMLVYAFTHLEALFLDASFVLIEVISGIVAAAISRISQRKTKQFPKGLFILEPVYVFFKSILIIFLMGFTTWSVSVKAYLFFTVGQGTKINVIPVLIYAIVMVILGSWLLTMYRRGNKKMKGASEILTVESKNSFIDVMMSIGIAFVAMLLMFIPSGSPLSFLLYTGDFFITIIIVLMFIGQPIGFMIQSVKEILGAELPAGPTKHTIEAIVSKHVSNCKKIFIFKKGMHIQVDVYLSPGMGACVLNSIKLIRDNLIAIFQLVDVDFMIDSQRENKQ